ncbi:6-phosphogluconolactonase-like protein [Leptotrombidium deliense]|uniref:6-phosphogluconolactonase n=1 Tax=Leptotrombidium deliense TaxID=299467 RepID=A0A443S4S5_9ACAR|nr:6-phosphogluconolactonase-like protein [Leptotrombidium deliense]
MRLVTVCKTVDLCDQKLVELIQTAVDGCKSDSFNVGLSGGSLVDVLCRVLPKIKTEWKKWHFFFCDERMVPFDDQESTFGAYKKKLIPNLSLSVDQFVTIDVNAKGNECAVDYESKLQNVRKLNGLPQFDLLFLGMGPDGHTCSIFPDHSLMSESTKWVAYIGDSPKPPPERVTFTFPVINNSKLALFAISGASKAGTLKEIFVEKKPLPAALVNPSEGDVHWVITEDSLPEVPDCFFGSH